jgi:hypothetical protein
MEQKKDLKCYKQRSRGNPNLLSAAIVCSNRGITNEPMMGIKAKVALAHHWQNGEDIRRYDFSYKARNSETIKHDHAGLLITPRTIAIL